MSPSVAVAHRLADRVHAVASLAVCVAARDAAAGEQIVDLADRHDRHPAAVSRSSSVSPIGVEREVVPVAVRVNDAGRADERPRDDAADAHAARRRARRRSRRCDRAPAIGIDVFVRGDLEHAVGRRVDDRLARAHVLGAEPLDDLGARGGDVAERAATDAPLELGDHVRRESRAETSGTADRARCPSSPSGPVTESLPGDASAIRPYAPRGCRPVRRDAAAASRRRRSPRSERAQGRNVAAECGAAMLPSVLLPSSP